jgi:uncharacterized protein
MIIPVFGPYNRDSTVELTGEIEDLDILSDGAPNYALHNSGTTEYSLVEPVHVICRLFRDGDILRIEGEVSARFAVQCSRCLEPLVRETSGVFTIVVKRMPPGEPVPPDDDQAEYRHPNVSGAHVGDPTMDGERLVYVEHQVTSLDVTGHVRDAVILSLPMKILCRDDCKGLCAACGGNLNEGDCGCVRTGSGAPNYPEHTTETPRDPRWRALAGMFEDNNKNEHTV